MNWDFLAMHINYLYFALLIEIIYSLTIYYHNSAKKDPDIAELIGISNSHALQL